MRIGCNGNKSPRIALWQVCERLSWTFHELVAVIRLTVSPDSFDAIVVPIGALSAPPSCTGASYLYPMHGGGSILDHASEVVALSLLWRAA